MSCRPFILIPQKEEDDLLRDIFPVLDQEIAAIVESGITVQLQGGRLIHAILDRHELKLIDGKMVRCLKYCLNQKGAKRV